MGWGEPKEAESGYRTDKLEALLEALSGSMRDYHKTLTDYLCREYALLDTYLVEGSGVQNRYPNLGQQPWDFSAQTHDVELVTWLMAFFPGTATNPTLQLDDHIIPLPAGAFTSIPMSLPVRNHRRRIAWGNVQATDQPFILLTARPAPANIPALLH